MSIKQKIYTAIKMFVHKSSSTDRSQQHLESTKKSSMANRSCDCVTNTPCLTSARKAGTQPILEGW